MLACLAVLSVPQPACSCRWALYASAHSAVSAGSSLILSPSNSLVLQSWNDPFLPSVDAGPLFDPAKLFQRNHGVNQDGWGLAWVGPDGDVHRHRSGLGATTKSEREGVVWQVDPALEDLASRVTSRVIFAHIRAATDGDRSAVNSHPFQYNRLLFMHNGGVPAGGEALLENSLTDRTCQAAARAIVSGDTDSEYIGALFCGHLHGNVCTRATFQLDELREAMVKTVRDVLAVSELCSPKSSSSLNFAVSDGSSVVVTRYRTCSQEEPPSLYVSMGATGGWDADREQLKGEMTLQAQQAPVVFGVGAIMVASEPITQRSSVSSTWRLLAKDEMLTFSEGTVHSYCLSRECVREWRWRCAVGTKEECITPPLIGIVVPNAAGTIDEPSTPRRVEL